MAQKKRLISLVTVIAVFAVMLFSLTYIAENFGHDCSGEHCPICSQIDVCRNTLENLSVATGTMAVMTALIYALCQTLSVCTDNTEIITLVSLKIELLN